MVNSVNGWAASPVPSAIHIQTYKIPGTNTSVSCRAEVAPLLLCFAADWNRLVMPVDHTPLDTWGYNYRSIAGSSSVSNHGSGTAIDLGSSRLPQHGHNLTVAQLKAVAGLISKYKVLTNGSQWSPAFRDEMHTEISNGVTLVQVQAVIKSLNLTVNGPGGPPMTDATAAAAVWNTKAKEYYDENGNGVRDLRTTADILFSAHAAALKAARDSAAALAIVQELAGTVTTNPIDVTTVLTPQQLDDIATAVVLKMQAVIGSGSPGAHA